MHKNLLRIVLLVSMLLPSPAFTAGSISVGDSIAGLEAQALLSGFSPSSSLELHLRTPAGEDVALTAFTDDIGDASVLLPADLTEKAGTYQLTGGKPGTATAQAQFKILPDRVDDTHSSIEAESTELVADGKSEAMVIVTLRDRFDNPLAGRPVELISSRSGDSITPVSSQTDTRGDQRFVLHTEEAGDIIFRAMDFLSGLTLKDRAYITADSAYGIVLLVRSFAEASRVSVNFLTV